MRMEIDNPVKLFTALGLGFSRNQSYERIQIVFEFYKCDEVSSESLLELCEVIAAQRNLR